MNYLRSVFGKKQIILAITGAVSLIIAGILILVCVRTAGKLSSQQFQKRWCKDESFTQISCYLSELSEYTYDKAKDLPRALEGRLKADSLTATNENARCVIMSYSAQGTADISSGKNTETVNAYGVGGDFFLFHPFKLLYGSYFDGDDLMDDRVILDKDTAWKLFGSSNVVGMVVRIGDREHVVCGVVERETGRLNDLAGNNTPTIYLSLNSLKNFGTFTYMSTIEALLPNPISNYASGIMAECLELDESRYTIVENSGRFHWTRLLQNAKNFGLRGMNTKGLVYPYWENVARGTEDVLTPVCVTAVLLIAFPCILMIMLLIRLYRKRTIHKKDIWEFIQDKIEDYREEKRIRIEDGDV